MIVILLIILVLFGAKKLPDLARGMGQAINEFQKAKDQFGQEITSSTAPRVNTPPVLLAAPAHDAPASEAKTTV